MGIGNFTTKIFGSANERRLKPFVKKVAAINALADTMQQLSDTELNERTQTLKARFKDGASLDDLLVDAFATVREGARRAIGLYPYDVQLIGGMVMHHGGISEMKTGEGKTLVATLPAYLHALTGKNVHIVTVNDYLAARDADWMGRVFEKVGLTTGCITNELNDQERRAAYACDITYATNNELGFDYLRDNMKNTLEEMVQRGHDFAIIDEVDSILIDEARTPLIISGPTDDKSDLYIAIDALIPDLVEDDYDLDEKQRTITLSEQGNENIETLLINAGLLDNGSLYEAANVSLVHHVNNALKAHKMFQRDKDYIVKNDKVVIIDEFTGRMMDGRRWSDGLHQAVEAKEKVEIQPENVTLASITFQNYFRLYQNLAGMTGTALTEEAEFAEIYGLTVFEIPTNKPVARADWDDELYISAAEKYKAIIGQIAMCHTQGQPVLVGTASIEKSELLSELLQNGKYFVQLATECKEKLADMRPGKDDDLIDFYEKRVAVFEKLGKNKTPVSHNVLNARFHEQEARIIAEAGVPGAVTIATNMAGRGTDIQLGGSVDLQLVDAMTQSDDTTNLAEKRTQIEANVAAARQKALDAGGLYVLATERHESRRIDNQLRGRSGRQGDPGTTKFFLSLEDDLMRIFGTGMEKMLTRFGIRPDESIEHPWFTKAVERAQKKIEQRNYDMRKNVLKYDDVINEQRKAIFEQRIEFMSADAVDDIITEMREQHAEDLIASHIPPKTYAENWDLDGLEQKAHDSFGQSFPIKDWAAQEGVADTEITDKLIESANALAAQRTVEVGAERMRQFEKIILLATIDRNWREHLQLIDHLRVVVGLRGMGQRDPLNEFKTESFTLFSNLLDDLRQDVTKALMNFQIQPSPEEHAQMVHERLATARPDRGTMNAVHMDPSTGENAAHMPEKATPAHRYGQSAGVSSMMSRKAAAQIDPNDPTSWGRVSRNTPCPCGSGKKYKHCHGQH